MSTVTISGTQIRLWCLVRGSSSAFYVTIGRDNFIIDLKEVIKNKKQNEFANVDVDQLVLWRVNIDQSQIKTTSIDDILNEEDELENSGLTVGETLLNVEGNSVRVVVGIPEQPGAVRTLSGSKENLYIIIDDSNLYIEGKYVIGEREKMGAFDLRRRQLCFDQLRIDYGQVLRTIRNRRTLGGDPIVVGSIPPSDSLWDIVRNEGFRVTTFPRNNKGFEKMVDVQVGHYIDQVLYNKVPATLALVAGDSDYKPILQTATELGWIIEIYFWNTADSLELLCEKNILGLSYKLFDPNNTDNPKFVSLNPFYKAITYGYGPEILYYGTANMKLLQLFIPDWETNEIMDFFNEIGVFGWWYRERNLTWFYFKSRVDMNKAENHLRNKYPWISFLRV